MRIASETRIQKNMMDGGYERDMSHGTRSCNCTYCIVCIKATPGGPGAGQVDGEKKKGEPVLRCGGHGLCIKRGLRPPGG